MKILQYIGAINLLAGAGGVKRVFCEMANALTERRHEVYAVCHTFQIGRPFYPLDDKVHFVNLDGSGRRKVKPHTWFKAILPFLPSVCKEIIFDNVEDPFNEKKGEPLVQFIRDIRPDIVIPFFVGDYFSMLRRPMLDVPVILSHHMNDREFIKSVNTRQRMEKINTCRHLHVLQQCFVPEIQKVYHGSIHVLPNVVPQIAEDDLADLRTDKAKRTITMISRLDPGKQQHMLIQAFGRLAKDYPDWTVEIYGPPSKRYYLRQLERMIVSLDIVGRVKLMGTTRSPLESLHSAEIFAFPSLFEGFPLALTEAMAVGLPCVGLKTTASVNELIVDGVNGFLTDNTPEDFAAKLKILMDDQDLRVQMGRAGHEMMKHYAPEKIWDQWENLIVQVVQGSAG